MLLTKSHYIKYSMNENFKNKVLIMISIDHHNKLVLEAMPKSIKLQKLV